LELRKIFLGDFSRRILTFYITPLLIIVFSVFMAISWILYPGFNLTRMEISQLGSPDLNPAGWVFWSIGMGLTGVLYLPIIPYINNRIGKINGKITKMGTILLYVSAIGSIGVGVIPQFAHVSFQTIHVINAGMALGGLYLGMFFWGLPLLKEKIMQKKLVLIAIFGWGAPIGFIITQSIRLMINVPEILEQISTLPWYFTFQTWEWLLMICIMAAFLILIYAIPEEF
jgi:hypothetical membrane protein